MILKNKDPFGGVHGESESSAPSPFKIDKDEALKEIQKSMDIWDEKNCQKSFLQTLREGKKRASIRKGSTLELLKKIKRIRKYSSTLVKKIIRTLANVPIKQVRVALNGLKAFYSQISSIKPDLSNPDILLCYNQSTQNYGLPEKKLQ